MPDALPGHDGQKRKCAHPSPSVMTDITATATNVK